ncbi:MAG: M20 family metallopeptidase [Candidatus Bipolaricaulia bacterium]
MGLTEKALEETIALARSLIRIRSVNPPGNEEEIARYIRGYLYESGLEAELVPLDEPGRSSLVGRLPGRERGSIVLCGHLDTVAVEEDEPWTKPPFEGLIEDGRLYGRGAADMKGGLAVILQAARLLAAKGRRSPRKTLLLALTADEEQGYRGAETLIERDFFADAEFMVVAEPTDGKVFIGEKGELWLRARFLGRAAHGSTPELGASAVLPAAAFCTRLNSEAAKLPAVEGLGKTTLNIGRFHGGWRVNIVPDRAEVELDFRVISEEAKERAIELVKRLGEEAAKRAGTGFEHELLSYHPPVFSDRNDGYVREFLARAGEAAPGPGVAPYCTDAATIIPKAQIPFVLFGPGSIALAHRPDEYVELGSLERALEVLLAFLKGALL